MADTVKKTPLRSVTITPKQGDRATELADRRGYDPRAPLASRRYWGGTYDPYGGTGGTKRA